MLVSFNDIVSSLGKLSADEVSDLQSRLSFLSQFDQDGPAELNTLNQASELYSCITDALKSICVGTPSWAAFRRTKHQKLYTQQLTLLDDFFIAFQSLRPAERRALYQFSITLVIDLLRERGLLIALRTVISHLHLIPSLFDQAFPGYLSQGMLPFLAQSLQPK